jgi:hypothetical protein
MVVNKTLIIVLAMVLSKSGLIAQKSTSFHLNSYTGISYGCTKYDRYADYAPKNTVFAVYSKPKAVLGLGLSVHFKMSAYFDLSLVSIVCRSGYQYNIYEFLTKKSERLEYNRVEVRNDLLLKAFIFTRKYPKKQKAKKEIIKSKVSFAQNLHCIGGYTNSVMLHDKYSFGIDNKSSLRWPFKRFTNGYILGIGNRISKLDVYLLTRVDLTSLAPDFGGRFMMRQIVLGTAFRL